MENLSESQSVSLTEGSNFSINSSIAVSNQLVLDIAVSCRSYLEERLGPLQLSRLLTWANNPGMG